MLSVMGAAVRVRSGKRQLQAVDGVDDDEDDEDGEEGS
jgi:hypothetical protein